MPFIVDTVSEVTYYENMLMGLSESLHNRAGVKNVYLRKYRPAPISSIQAWEERHGVVMPEDIRLFYLSSDGFAFEYIYALSGNDADDKVVCGIQVNSLEDLAPVFGYETTQEAGVVFNGERYVIRLSLESKLFEVTSLSERGQVLLVYLYPRFSPTIWVRTSTACPLYFLATDLTTYLRMAVAHLGIPYWQVAYSPEGLPPWSENMFRLLAPHLLPLKGNVECMIREDRRRKTDEDFPKARLNRLDPDLFNQLPRPEHPQLPARLPELPQFPTPVRWQVFSPEPEKMRMVTGRYGPCKSYKSIRRGTKALKKSVCATKKLK